MALVLQLPHDLEQVLLQQAKVQGVSPAGYVQSLLEKQLSWRIQKPKLSPEEFEAALDQLAQFSDQIPHLPDEAITRESMYKSPAEILGIKPSSSE